MSWLRKLAATLRPGRLDNDLDAELEFHLQQRTDHLIAQGLSPAEAHRQAALLFGNRTALRESARDRDILAWLETTLHDLRFAARTLRRSPGFASAAILSLALGIGANTALFSIIDRLLLKRLPAAEPHRLVRLTSESGSLTYPAYDLLRTRSRFLSGVIATGRLNQQSIEERGETVPAAVQEVSGNYFDVLGISPARGRVFHAADAKAPGVALAVISHSFWQSHFLAQPSALGAHFRYHARDFVIIGIAPRGFRGFVLDQPADIWQPIEQSEPPNSILLTKGAWLQVIGRLQPDASPSQAAEEATSLLRRKISAEPGANGFSALRGRYSRPLLVLEGVVGLVLLIACANLANLMLAGAAARQREIAVRQALGAARSRLIRQMLTESLLVSASGAALAILVAWWLSRALLRFLPPTAAPALANLSFQPDPRTLAFTAAVALLTALAFGLAPALRATRPPGRASRRFASRSLVILEVSLCTVLLIGAGLFLRSLRSLRTLDPGFESTQLIVADVRADSPLTVRRHLETLRSRAAALPGVTAAGYSHIRQLSGFDITANIEIEGRPAAANEKSEKNEASGLHISPGFFAAMGTPVLAGRDFSDHDNPTARPVAIVNQAFARRFFPAPQDPIGRHFGIDGPASAAAFEIVGVVKDTRWTDLRTAPAAMYYRPALQAGAGSATLAVRASTDLATLSAALRQTAHDLDPHLTLNDMVPFTEMEDRNLVIERMVAQVSTAFGLLALMVACIGLYGVLAYNVARRTREIGIRMALGASRRAVQWIVLRESLLLLALGFTLGLPAALATTRLIATMLYGLTPADPVTIAAALATLTTIALAASFLPARRASRVDPQIALRFE